MSPRPTLDPRLGAEICDKLTAQTGKDYHIILISFSYSEHDGRQDLDPPQFISSMDIDSTTSLLIQIGEDFKDGTFPTITGKHEV